MIVVDDDSPDGTWQVVEEVAKERNRPDHTVVFLVRRTTESGLTSAIQRGIDEAIRTLGADIVTWMDCDLSMPPEDVPKLVLAIVERVRPLSTWPSAHAGFPAAPTSPMD